MLIAIQKSPFHKKKIFTSHGFKIKEMSCNNESEFLDLISEADAALVNTLPLVTKNILERSKKLKVISRMGVGVDSINLDEATKKGIMVCNVPGINTTEVAEHALALFLSINRNIIQSVQKIKEGEWQNKREIICRSVKKISDQVIGIIGFGNIGKAFSSRIKAFNPKEIIVVDPKINDVDSRNHGVKLVDLKYLFKNSDAISIHCSLNKSTFELINQESIKLLKKEAIIINTARGEIIDENALYSFLHNKKVAAAGLDVCNKEPINPKNKLLKISNCYITPHVAGYSKDFIDLCPIKQAENVINVLKGIPPHGLANPEVIKVIAKMRNQKKSRWHEIPDFQVKEFRI